MGDSGMMKIRQLAELIAWAAAAYLLASYSSPMIVAALGLLYGSPADAPPSVLQNLVYISPVFPLLLGIAAVVRLKLAGDNVWARIGFSGKTLPKDSLTGLVAGIASIGIAVVCLRVASLYMNVPPMHLMPPQVHLFFITIGALVPGICEELYFRGMLMRVGDRLPKAALILLTSAAFSVWHIGAPAYLAHTFLLGLIFGTLASVTGRLAPSIIAHTIANAGMGLLLLSGYSLSGQ
jgi:membrane protease YdiL (CAAX protease family)